MNKGKVKKCDYPIRIPEGNRFALAIPMQKVSWECGCKLTMPWEPNDGDVIRLFLVTPHARIEVRNLNMEGGLLSFEDKGTLAAGTYDIDCSIVRANGERYGYYLKGKLRIVQANDEAGIAGTYEIDGAVVLYAKGDKGDPGQDGTVSFDELSPEQIEMLKGDKGDDGTGIASIVQTQTATESEGVNIVTVTMDDDEQNPTTYQFEVRNGEKGDDGDSAYQVYYDDAVAKGEEPLSKEDWLASLKGEDGTPGAPGEDGDDGKSAYQIAVEHGFDGTEEEWLASLKGEDGDKGDDGDSAYQVYLSTVPQGETPMTKEQWLASLKGEQGDQGPMGDTVILGEGQNYTLYGVLGSNTNGAMTQKAVTDLFVEVTSTQVEAMIDP